MYFLLGILNRTIANAILANPESVCSTRVEMFGPVN